MQQLPEIEYAMDFSAPGHFTKVLEAQHEAAHARGDVCKTWLTDTSMTQFVPGQLGA